MKLNKMIDILIEKITIFGILENEFGPINENLIRCARVFEVPDFKLKNSPEEKQTDNIISYENKKSCFALNLIKPLAIIILICCVFVFGYYAISFKSSTVGHISKSNNSHIISLI